MRTHHRYTFDSNLLTFSKENFIESNLFCELAFSAEFSILGGIDKSVEVGQYEMRFLFWGSSNANEIIIIFGSKRKKTSANTYYDTKSNSMLRNEAKPLSVNFNTL